jgi:hypothetical protein
MHVCVDEVAADPGEETEDEGDAQRRSLPPLKITKKPNLGAAKGMTLHF